jgi:hypothetical protein
MVPLRHIALEDEFHGIAVVPLPSVPLQLLLESEPSV